VVQSTCYISLGGNSDQVVQLRVEVVSQGGYDSSSNDGSVNGLLYQSLSIIYFSMLSMTLSNSKTILQCLHAGYLQLLQQSSVL
jgi:hypothetical protein